MNEIPENSNNNGTSTNDLEPLDYLREVESSTCLLLSSTPSPTPLDFKHPLSEEMNDSSFLGLKDDPTLLNLQNSGDSSSSVGSNSVVQDPVSAQLINNISMLEYHTLSKNGDLVIGQVEDCKLNGNGNVTNRKLPSFVNWNWPVIRKVLLWIVVSALVACMGAIIAMLITIPRECNPDIPWHQGKVFYEVFPASFKDSNNDRIGDLKGLITKLDYIENLGASAIRLNYIFEAQNYPEHYYNSTSILSIDPSLGGLKDFQDLVSTVHSRNMSLVLDIPVLSMATHTTSLLNSTHTVLLSNNSTQSYADPTSAAITFWARAQNVDGFYLKNLEKYVDDPNFIESLQAWKQIIGFNKIFIVSEETLTKCKGVALNVLLTRIDLVDIHLDLTNGVAGLKEKISGVLKGILWEKPHYPWVHWNIGNINSERISSQHLNNTLALTTLQFVLPGTVSIFYGDEIGLGGIPKTNIKGVFPEPNNVTNAVPMRFANSKAKNDIAFQSWHRNSHLDPQYQFLEIISMLTKVRVNTPTIYLKSIYKEGNILRNADVRETDDNLVVIERWYPRRNTCVFVGNLGNQSVTTDLSAMFYGGTVVAGTNMSLLGQVIYFDEVTFPPNSAIILKLEK